MHFRAVCMVPAFRAEIPMWSSHGSGGWGSSECALKVKCFLLIQTCHTGALFIDSQALVSQGTLSAAHQVHLALQVFSTKVSYSLKEGTACEGGRFHVRWGAIKVGLRDVLTSCFRSSPHNPSAASDLSTYSTASLISNEEQFEDYGEGDDVDFTPSSPCPDDESRTNAYSDLGSSVSSRLLLIH